MIQSQTPVERIIQAGREGFNNTESVLTPPYQQALDEAKGVLPAVGRFGVSLLNTARADVNAAFRAGQQFLQEATPDIHAPSLPPGVTIPLGGNRQLSGELTPGSLPREVAALPEAFPTGFGMTRPTAPHTHAQALDGAHRGTFDVGATKVPVTTLDELTGAVRRATPPPTPPPPGPPTHVWSYKGSQIPITPTGAEHVYTDGRTYLEVRERDGSIGVVPKDEVQAIPSGPAAAPTHIWRSKDHDYPVTPTGVEHPYKDGRTYAEVRQPDGTVTHVPKDELQPAPRAAGAEPAAAEIRYTTARGSKYIDHGDGTSTRDKSYHPEHGPDDQGPQPRSDRTIYVTPEDAAKLGEIQTQGGARRIIAPLGDGRWGIKYLDGPDAGKFERRSVITPEHEPAVGLTPVEMWNDGRGPHFGNEITEVRRAEGAAPEGAVPEEGSWAAADAGPVDPKTGFPIREPGEPHSMAYGKRVASHLYDVADNSGAYIQPGLVNRYMNYITNKAERTRLGSISGKHVPGAQAFNDLVADLQTERNRPWSIREIHELDEDLGDLITADYKNNRGLSTVGYKLLDAQRTLREMIDKATEADVGGGAAGFVALKSARQAYSQAMKLGDLERMEARAEATGDRLKSLRKQVDDLKTNSKKSRGYTPEELAALTSMAKNGVINTAVQAVGKRLEFLLPLWIEAHSGGLTGGLTSYGAVRGIRGATGWAAKKAQTRRLNKAREVIGGRIPTGMPTP